MVVDIVCLQDTCYGRSAVEMLFPEVAGAVDPLAIYAADSRVPKPNRPYVLLNMITSVDGATDVAGVSGGLSSPGDKVVFAAIRAVADIILVGAQTLRSEGYGPPKANPAAFAERAKHKQAPRPRLAIVSASLDLDFTAALFDDEPVPLVFTATEAPPDRLAQARQRCEVHCLGTRRLHLAEVVRRLGELDADVVLAEGGPGLNSQLVASGTLDELCWTVAPLLVGSNSARLLAGAPAGLDRLALNRVLKQEDTLFLRYLAG